MNRVAHAYGRQIDPNFSGETPLHNAALAGNTVAIQWLLDPHNCQIDPNAVNKYGTSFRVPVSNVPQK